MTFQHRKKTIEAIERLIADYFPNFPNNHNILIPQHFNVEEDEEGYKYSIEGNRFSHLSPIKVSAYSEKDCIEFFLEELHEHLLYIKDNVEWHLNLLDVYKHNDYPQKLYLGGECLYIVDWEDDLGIVRLYRLNYSKNQTVKFSKGEYKLRTYTQHPRLCQELRDLIKANQEILISTVETMNRK